MIANHGLGYDMYEGRLYQKLLDRFLAYKNENSGPYDLSLVFVQQLLFGLNLKYDRNKIRELRQKLVDEFCPIELFSKKRFNIEQRIADLDDSTDYIYAFDRRCDNYYPMENIYILRISSEPIAMLLWLSW
jgi:hypothetical protein